MSHPAQIQSTNIQQYFDLNKSTKELVCNLCGWVANTTNKFDTAPLILHFNKHHPNVIQNRGSNPGAQEKGNYVEPNDYLYGGGYGAVGYNDINSNYQQSYAPESYQQGPKSAYNSIYNDFQHEQSSHYQSQASAVYPYQQQQQNQYSNMFQQSYMESNVQPYSEMNAYNVGFGKMDRTRDRVNGVQRGGKKKRGRRTKKEMMEIRERQARERMGYSGYPQQHQNNQYNSYGNYYDYQQPYQSNQYPMYPNQNMYQMQYPPQYIPSEYHQYPSGLSQQKSQYMQPNQFQGPNYQSELIRPQLQNQQSENYSSQQLSQLNQQEDRDSQSQHRNQEERAGQQRVANQDNQLEEAPAQQKQGNNQEQIQQFIQEGNYNYQFQKQLADLGQNASKQAEGQPNQTIGKIENKTNQKIMISTLQNKKKLQPQKIKQIKQAHQKNDFSMSKVSQNDSKASKAFNIQPNQYESYITKQKSKEQSLSKLRQYSSAAQLPYADYQNISNRPPLFLQKMMSPSISSLAQSPVGYPPTPSYISSYKHKSGYSISSHIIKEFFRSIDFGLNKESVIIMAKNKLNVDEEQAKNLVQEMWWGQRSLLEINPVFKERGHILRQTYNKSTILILQKNIQQQYLRYSECLYVLTYQKNIKLPYSQIPYSAHILLCCDWRSEYIFIGVAFTKEELGQAVEGADGHVEGIVEMLEIFYEAVGGFVNNSIVASIINGGKRQYEQNKQSQEYDQYQRIFKQAVQTFNHKYQSKINFVMNLAINPDVFYEKTKKMRQQQQNNKMMKMEVQQQIRKFNEKIKQMLVLSSSKKPVQTSGDQYHNQNENQQKNQICQGDTGIPSQIQSLTIRFIKSKRLSENQLEQYNPFSICFQRNQQSALFFTGLITKIKQCQSLRRKLYWISKPFTNNTNTVTVANEPKKQTGVQAVQNSQDQVRNYSLQMENQKCPQFCELISAIFRFSRYLRKIGKQTEFDLKHEYRYYKHQFMYKLSRKYGPKIFEEIYRNYSQALKLKHRMVSPITLTIIEHPNNQVDLPEHEENQYQQEFQASSPIISVTYTLQYSLQHCHWICNCNKIYQTGIPCRHLIYVILQNQGSVDHYVNERWIGWKSDRQKLRGFRAKCKGDRDS